MAKDEDPLKLRQRETAITNLLSAFSETPSSQEVALLLQEPLGNLRNLLGAGVKQQIDKAWKQEIMPAGKEIEKGYPFEDGSADADLTKLAAYLNPNDGKFSKFYKEKIEKYFEEADGKLKQKEGAEIQFTDDFITYLNSAISLRKALFGTNPTPKFTYEFRLKGDKSTLVEVSIDGQKINSEGTGSINGTFPGSGSETGVIVNAASTSGTASTTGSANSNTSSSTSTASGPKTYPGVWGLFKFVDDGKPQKQADGSYTMSYSVGGKPLSASIKPSGGDPFDKSLFRNLKAPQTVVK